MINSTEGRATTTNRATEGTTPTSVTKGTTAEAAIRRTEALGRAEGPSGRVSRVFLPAPAQRKGMARGRQLPLRRIP
jgi:hypothetical protein